jgi:hypothetical protein
VGVVGVVGMVGVVAWAVAGTATRTIRAANIATIVPTAGVRSRRLVTASAPASPGPTALAAHGRREPLFA